MADRENVVGHLYDCLAESKPDIMWVFVRKNIVGDALDLLKEQPEIVRCKDCKHDCGRGHGMYCQFIECEITGAFHKEDWFCADGEKG